MDSNPFTNITSKEHLMPSASKTDLSTKTFHSSSSFSTFSYTTIILYPILCLVFTISLCHIMYLFYKWHIQDTSKQNAKEGKSMWSSKPTSTIWNQRKKMILKEALQHSDTDENNHYHEQQQSELQEQQQREEYRISSTWFSSIRSSLEENDFTMQDVLEDFESSSLDIKHLKDIQGWDEIRLNNWLEPIHHGTIELTKFRKDLATESIKSVEDMESPNGKKCEAKTLEMKDRYSRFWSHIFAFWGRTENHLYSSDKKDTEYREGELCEEELDSSTTLETLEQGYGNHL